MAAERRGATREETMTKTLIAMAAALLGAGAALAQPAPDGPPQKVVNVTVYGSDPCPKGSDDEIVPYPALYTTMSLRRSGFSAYTETHFIEIRTAANRRPPAGWPIAR